MKIKRNYDPIDELGILEAQIADLTVKAVALKEEVAARGEGAFEGQIFRATVSFSERKTLKMKAVRAKLSPQFIAANTKVTPVTTVKVVAKNGVKIAA